MHVRIRLRSAEGWLIAAVAVAMTLVGCSGGTPEAAPDVSSPVSSPSSAAAAPEPTTPAASATEGTEPATKFSLDQQRDVGFPNLDSEVLPTAVGQGAQDGYTRVVIYFDGTGAPHYSAEYVDAPTADGSGKPITMRGTAFVQLMLSGIRTPGEGEELAPRLTDGVDGVADVYVGAPFEGMTQVVVGVDSKSPFRVFTLEAPSRLVIDVKTI